MPGTGLLTELLTGMRLPADTAWLRVAINGWPWQSSGRATAAMAVPFPRRIAISGEGLGRWPLLRTHGT